MNNINNNMLSLMCGRGRDKREPLEERLRRQRLLIGICGPRVVRFGRGRMVRHDVRLSGYHAIVCGVLRLRVAVLRMVKFLAHHVVQRAALEVQYLLERPSEVSIQRGVDHGIEQRVGVAQPQEQAAQ